MIPSKVKNIWFFVACWLPLFIPALMLNQFLSQGPLLGENFAFVFLVVRFFILLSLIVMIIDLWISGKGKQAKLTWTIMLVFFYLIIAPFYWVTQVLEKREYVKHAVIAVAVVFIGTLGYAFSLFF